MSDMGQIEDTNAVDTEHQKHSSMNRVFVWGLLIVFLIFLGFGLLRTQRGPAKVGEKAPEFTITTFDGMEYKLSDFRGDVIVVNFWSSWCKPCEQEAEVLETAWRQYKGQGDVLFIGVNYVDTEPEAMGYLNKFNISFPNGADLGTKISQAYRIRGVPETYVIDRNGILAFTLKGPFQSLSQITSVIDSLLEP